MCMCVCACTIPACIGYAGGEDVSFYTNPNMPVTVHIYDFILEAII